MDYHNLLLTDLSVSTLALYHQQSNHGDPFEMEPPISSLRPNHITVLCFTQVFSSVAQSCQTVCEPMDCRTPDFPVHHQLLELLKLMSIELVMPSNDLILCHPLLLQPSILPSVRVFSSESALLMRWPKY